MPRFSVAFAKRKATVEDFENVQSPPSDQPSFRVMERNNFSNGRSFDGGARMARASGNLMPKSNQLEVQTDDDNIFADMKGNRGSGVSNTTQATSTGNSSRHSNTSTAPSSTDVHGGHGHDEARHTAQNSPPDGPNRAGSKTIGNSFLNKAGRTFSFGGQKKQSVPPPKEEPAVPTMPPVLTLMGENEDSRTRAMTASTSSTATPSKPEASDMDLGGDFGSMFTSFDKRASNSTVTNNEPRSLTGNRRGQPPSTSPDMVAPGEPLLRSWSDRSAADDGVEDRPPPVPRHQAHGSFKYSNRPSNIVEDEDAKFMSDSFTAIKFLSGSNDTPSNPPPPTSGRYRRDEDSFMATSRKPIASNFAKEDNMFDGSLSRFSKVASSRYTPRTINNASKNKVMTPAEFERYRQDKERAGAIQQTAKPTQKDEEDEDEDEINYDDEEDDAEKARQAAKQRRKQEAHMTVYRQQMMKVTGESQPPMSRPTMVPSMSAPQLNHLKAPSPGPQNGASDGEDDEEVPLGILQAHGFPNKNRPPIRVNSSESNPNLRASAQGAPGRPASAMGDASGGGHRQSGLPAFARRLPQDPFVGAGIAKPAVRESLSLGDAGQPGQSHGPMPPGGLVGVIASEERSRAMRRGSPNIENQRQMGGNMNGYPGPGFDPAAGIPHQAMYGQGGMGAPGGMQGMQGMPGMPGMPQMPSQMLSPNDHAQMQMNQQMQQFMQMQMQFMQMMSGNQNGGGPPMQQPYGNGGLGFSNSMADMSSRQSMMGDQMMGPPQMNHGMRTMSMVQPSSSSFIQQPLNLPSIHTSPPMGYTPSIAPSERSNIGLPGRYRPVSSAAQSPAPNHHRRASTMSGALSAWDDDKSRSTVKIVPKSGDASDEDDDEGWEAMKAKRDKKRSIWKSKKTYESELNSMM